MDLGLSGKACIVTGASSGIGLATADLLEREGAQVLRVSRGERFQADVTEPDAAERIIAECTGRFGAVDVLVNNAGTMTIASLGELSDDDWQSQWELHVIAPMRLMRAAAPLMAERGWGRIVNVCSSSGRRPSLRNAAYSVTKAAELSLSRVFADEYAGTGVLVNAVTPGPVATELWTGDDGLAAQAAQRRGTTREDELAAAGEKVPIGRLGEPGEVAAVVAFLCSDQASNVLGSAWAVDGGAVPFAF
ncbi:MAG: SDR family NAD(P)-dependent oxidoreductase [Thermoleophilaceae bacterium]